MKPGMVARRNMEKGKQIYEGKAKKVFETDNPDLLIQEFKDDHNRADALERAQRVHGILQKIPVWQDEGVVPHDSLFREFIGGSSYSY